MQVEWLNLEESQRNAGQVQTTSIGGKKATASKNLNMHVYECRLAKVQHQITLAVFFCSVLGWLFESWWQLKPSWLLSLNHSHAELTWLSLSLSLWTRHMCSKVWVVLRAWIPKRMSAAGSRACWIASSGCLKPLALSQYLHHVILVSYCINCPSLLYIF